MNKFSYKTLSKYAAQGFVLGVILLFVLVNSAFVDASIIVTGSGPVEEDLNEGWGIIVTGSGPVEEDQNEGWGINVTGTSSDSNSNYSSDSHYSSSDNNETTATTIPYPVLATASHPPCYNPPCTTTTTCPSSSCTRYTCNSNYQCVVDSNGQYTSLSTCQNNCIAPTRYSCNTNTYQCYVATNGAYANLNDCVNACQTPITRYACNTYTWQCVSDSSGPYTSLNACQNNCIAQTRYSCNYSTYQCYQSTSGPYISYNDCANACQQTNQSLSVSCYASPNPVRTNQTVTFYSNVSGGSGNYSYYWSGATYGNSSYSQKSFSSSGNYTAYLTVNDSQNRSASTSCSVNVNDQCTNTGTLSLWADKYTMSQGESTYIRWTSTNANYCTASNGWTGSKSTSGYESISPNSDTTYSLTCYGSCGQVTRSITIYVTSTSTNLSLTKLGRNLSAGERVYSKVIRVTEGDVIEFHLTVTAGNNKDLYNVNMKDIMPSVLSYMSGTTKINGIVQPDTITTTGLSLGTIYKGASKTIVFQAISASPGTYLTYTNTAEITADNESKITDSASITYGLVAGAATIRTGPLNTWLMSFIISLVLSLMIWYYLKFNPKGQLVFVKSENKIRDIWLEYARRRIMHSN